MHAVHGELLLPEPVKASCSSSCARACRSWEVVRERRRAGWAGDKP